MRLSLSEDNTLLRSPYLTQMSLNCNILPYGSVVLTRCLPHTQLQLLFYVFLLSFVFYNRDLYNSLALFLYRFLSLFNNRFSLRLHYHFIFFSTWVFRFACHWLVYLLRSALKRQHPYSWVVRKHGKVRRQFS